MAGAGLVAAAALMPASSATALVCAAGTAPDPASSSYLVRLSSPQGCSMGFLLMKRALKQCPKLIPPLDAPGPAGKCKNVAITRKVVGRSYHDKATLTYAPFASPFPVNAGSNVSISGTETYKSGNFTHHSKFKFKGFEHTCVNGPPVHGKPACAVNT